VSLGEIRGGKSADYLRRSGQEHDLEYVLSHIDDLDIVPCMVEWELVAASKFDRERTPKEVASYRHLMKREALVAR
jgi:hypothetical protein